MSVYAEWIQKQAPKNGVGGGWETVIVA